MTDPHLGDLYYLYRCPDCAGRHEELILPLDDRGAALGVALGVAWVHRYALGHREQKLLVAAEIDGRPYAVAVAIGERLTGAIECLDTHPARGLTPGQAYDLAAKGAPLTPQPADDAGIDALVMGAFRRAASDRAEVERLLKGIKLE